MQKTMTRGERVIAFIEKYCIVPEGSLIGKPVKLIDFQKKFILDVYDNPLGTSRAYLSIARKNGKTAFIACLLLAHIVGPEAYPNSHITSGARTREQAGQVFKYASKMVWRNPALTAITRVIPSGKTIIGLAKNVEYKAISADAAGAHGGSPILAILDEVGQVKGPTDDFIEAIETSQGAYEGRAMLFAISTQSATDNDMFSRWIDDAETSKDPRIVSHVYAASKDAEVDDPQAMRDANPALGIFRSLTDIMDAAARAKRMPSYETSYRWLYLNQRIDASAPFVSPAAWKACYAPKLESFEGLPVFAGIDLSSVNDLTALVLMAPQETSGGIVWNVKPTFWLPADNLYEKSKADRVPYDVWAKDGALIATPGPTIDYAFIAAHLKEILETLDVRSIAFDQWRFDYLKQHLTAHGVDEALIDGDAAIFKPFGQGYRSFAPALDLLETFILNRRLVHNSNPALNMCMMNAIVRMDPAANRKLDKDKARGRIDGAVALAMATAMAGTYEPEVVPKSPWDDPEFTLLADK